MSVWCSMQVNLMFFSKEISRIKSYFSDRKKNSLSNLEHGGHPPTPDVLLSIVYTDKWGETMNTERSYKNTIRARNKRNTNNYPKTKITKEKMSFPTYCICNSFTYTKHRDFTHDSFFCFLRRLVVGIVTPHRRNWTTSHRVQMRVKWYNLR